MDKLLITPTLLSLAAGAAAIFAAGIWWLIRIRQNRIWLPTVRILRLESPQLPKLRMIRPPLIPFLCFLLSAAALFFFTLRPKQPLYTPLEREQVKIHVFFDMSASTSDNFSIDSYAQLASKLVAPLLGKGRVSVATSHDQEVIEVKAASDVDKLIHSRGFHRAGLRLGSALQGQLEKMGTMDRLFIVSDRDQHSWSDFNWQYLVDDMEVLWVPTLPESRVDRTNYFINKVSLVSSPSAMTMDWEISIERSDASADATGGLKVSYGNQILADVPWSMPPGMSKVVVKASWPTNALGGSANSSKQSLAWSLEGLPSDSISLDNTFRTAVTGIGQHVTLIGAAAGEQILDDPSHQLAVSLEILGLRLRRFDRIEQPGPDAVEYPFWVIVGGDSPMDSYCPASLTQARLAFSATSKENMLRAMPKIWLVPTSLEANYSDLCWCYFRLLKSDLTAAAKPNFCQDITNRDSYVRVLTSLGAKQIGGSVGSEEDAIAFSGADEVSGLQVLAFTLPLRPSRKTGIDHAKLPILVKELLAWQNLLDIRDNTSSWPRIADNTKEMASTDALGTRENALALSNVPYGESILESMPIESMPPKWTAQVIASVKQLPMKKDRDDPTPWILVCAIIILVAMIIELIWYSGLAVLKLMRRRSDVALLFALGIGLYGESSWAQIALPTLGYPSAKMSFATIGIELSQRTSLSLAKEPESFSAPTDDLLGLPMIWAQNAAFVSDKEGVLLEEIARWLKRGGILLVEGNQSREALLKLTSRSFRGTGESHGWTAIPPDHALMRSFYLLDSLPNCGGEVWSGFHFDDRLAILAIPMPFLEKISDGRSQVSCNPQLTQEILTRTFVNILMMSLSTDYKKDQIHLPEILKRLR